MVKKQENKVGIIANITGIIGLFILYVVIGVVVADLVIIVYSIVILVASIVFLLFKKKNFTWTKFTKFILFSLIYGGLALGIILFILIVYRLYPNYFF